ncbi:MAG: helix-hairpin-helix domain-containing protein [Candidatus Saccharicenans sp.]|nr:helix-hairpin-helix domain-containing protein [Candidatus Saccharicenans sp.]MDI6848226.1 helix-hairpin-helix domain-containing protein [Candidatus Saccharicenans sp.]
MTGGFKKVLAAGLLVLMGLMVFSPGFAQNQPKAGPGKININTASAAELQNLPRIGPKVAQRIVDYRTQNGPFKKIEDIMKVRGIGEKVFNQIKDLITVGEGK